MKFCFVAQQIGCLSGENRQLGIPAGDETSSASVSGPNNISSICIDGDETRRSYGSLWNIFDFTTEIRAARSGISLTIRQDAGAGTIEMARATWIHGGWAAKHSLADKRNAPIL